MKSPKHLLLLLFLLLGISTTVAAHPLDNLEKGGVFKVVDVVDGDTVRLDNGRQVRFVGIQAPKLPLGRKNFPEWPLAAEAKSALEKLCLHQSVTLYYGDTKEDRHGRILAHLLTEDGVWLQGDMLQKGLARVYTFPDNRRLATDMLAQEQNARQHKRGIWPLAFYAIRQPNHLNKDIGTFQVIEGRVLETAKVKGTVYLNFGDDWRSDFTIAINSKARRIFDKEGIDLLALKDKKVRVRGWLKKRNGPMIEASHPEQIELLN